MKKILITGAGSGLGKASSIKLAQNGYFVYATTHNSFDANKLNNLASKLNIPLKSFKLDINNKNDRLLINNLDIDILINNAAIGDSGFVGEVNIDRYKTVFETNVFSTLALTQIVLKNMIENNKGKIIFISSLLGRVPRVFLSPYASSKFAIECIAISLKEELNYLKNSKIQVSIIEPGAYHTGFNQKNISKQFSFTKNNSYFNHDLNFLKDMQFNYFKLVELKSLNSIVKKYVTAVKDTNMKTRYIAPKIQGYYIQLLRILGN